VRVPRRGTGAESPVVAEKALYWRGSEGATSFSFIAGSTSHGRNLVDKAKPFSISKRQVWEAYKRVKANQGAAGVEGQSITEFEEDLENNLYKLWNRMASGSYFPPPVRRVEIPKGDGSGTRPFGIPTVSDRVAQAVVKAYLEPELEPYFHPDSYGYRPGKSALEAVGVARQRCWRYDWVLDLDIRRYFDYASCCLLREPSVQDCVYEWSCCISLYHDQAASRIRDVRMFCG
jgi:retron-type reverse transcriptase